MKVSVYLAADFMQEMRMENALSPIPFTLCSTLYQKHMQAVAYTAYVLRLS